MQSITNDMVFSDKELLSDFKNNLSSLNSVIKHIKNLKIERKYAKINVSLLKGDKIHQILENTHSKLTDVLLLTHIKDTEFKTDLKLSLNKFKELKTIYETEKLIINSIVNQSNENTEYLDYRKQLINRNSNISTASNMTTKTNENYDKNNKISNIENYAQESLNENKNFIISLEKDSKQIPLIFFDRTTRLSNVLSIKYGVSIIDKYNLKKWGVVVLLILLLIISYYYIK